MKINFLQLKTEAGYMGIFLFLILVALFILVLPQDIETKPAIPNTDECYIKIPNPAFNVKFQNQDYRLIRARSATITEEIKAHFIDMGKIKNFIGEDRTAYTAWIDGFKPQPKAGIYGPITGIEDLLFIHSDGEATSSLYPGHVFLDIYLRADKEVPPFIINFCESITRVKPFPLFLNQDKETTPPLFINTSDLYDLKPSTERDCGEECTPPPNTRYALVSYEQYRGRINLREEGWWPSGKVKVKVNQVENEYVVNYAFLTPIKLIALFMPDPEDPATLLQFNYIPESMATPAREAIPDLNINYQDENWNQDSLMLRAFLPLQIPNWGWWTPECKPAIYLYPKNKMNVNVKVSPRGHLTYTDPVYDAKKGWNVTAYPNGQLTWLDNTYGLNSRGEKRSSNIYDYLYYESKIHDQSIDKPTTGYIIAYADLEQFYKHYLPKTGLNLKETQDYINYWLTVLPRTDYYFIGFLSPQNIDQIEPLQITPHADTSLRVRLYYEALTTAEAMDKSKNIKQPEFQHTFKRTGFTVVEWGGMVKRDKNHPFTCSM